jgi:hypothetical protein
MSHWTSDASDTCLPVDMLLTAVDAAFAQKLARLEARLAG